MEAGPPQELIAMAYGRIAAWHARKVLNADQTNGAAESPPNRQPGPSPTRSSDHPHGDG